MAESSSQASPPDPPVRFSLSTALWVMTAIAIVAAAVGPFWRALDAQQRLAWAVYGSTAILAFAVNAIRERHLFTCLAHRAGAARFRLRYSQRQHDMAPWRRCSLSLATIGAAAVLHLGVANAIERGAAGFFQLVVIGLLVGILVAACLIRAVLAWQNVPSIRLCENGILLIRQFIPWDRVHGFQAMPTRPDALVIHMLFLRLRVKVPDAIRDDVEQFLRENIGENSPERPTRETASG